VCFGLTFGTSRVVWIVIGPGPLPLDGPANRIKSDGMRFLIPLVLAFALPLPALAQSCPEPQPRTEERQALLDQLAGSKNASDGQRAAGELWEFWMEAPDETAQDMLQDGMAQRVSYALVEAETILDGLVRYCPTYAEGWNQRAFVRFLREDYEGSLADIEETLKREPAHFGALSGKALALMRQGKPGLAKLTVVRALQVHPWLNERALLGDSEDI